MAVNIDKLALVTKVLMDRRFLEMKEENEVLKLKVFWQKHKIKKLIFAMDAGNSVCGPACKCESCFDSELTGELDFKDIEQRTCGFKPWFDAKVIACGLTIGGHTGERRSHESGPKYNIVYDNDYHIVYHLRHGERPTWSEITYGGKLWKAKSVSDPEIKKLVALFKSIYDDVDIALGFDIKQ